MTGGYSTIELSNHNFPDKEFRKYLKQFDINHNNKLESAERNVKVIDVSGKGIETLEGIQHFPKLEELWRSDNKLTSMDVSKNEKLETLYCYDNQLASLDVTQNIALKRLR